MCGGGGIAKHIYGSEIISFNRKVDKGKLTFDIVQVISVVPFF